jgi:hypothetical protein
VPRTRAAAVCDAVRALLLAKAQVCSLAVPTFVQVIYPLLTRTNFLLKAQGFNVTGGGFPVGRPVLSDGIFRKICTADQTSSLIRNLTLGSLPLRATTHSDFRKIDMASYPDGNK